MNRLQQELQPVLKLLNFSAKKRKFLNNCWVDKNIDIDAELCIVEIWQENTVQYEEFILICLRLIRYKLKIYMWSRIVDRLKIFHFMGSKMHDFDSLFRRGLKCMYKSTPHKPFIH